MFEQARAILWAQWRGLLNFYPRTFRAGAMLSSGLTLLWYAICAFAAWAVYSLLSEMKDPARIEAFLRQSLFFATGYWQFVPVMLATTGLSLELRKLIVYPIPHGQLYLLELLLRTSTSVEVLLVTTGMALGVLVNPNLHWWASLVFIPFVLFNLALSAGITELQKRIFARKYLREAAVLVVVLLGAIPQLLLTTGLGGKAKVWYAALPTLPVPWSATAKLAVTSGQAPVEWVAMLFWLLFAWWFGRWQFERGLRFDSEAQQSAERVGDVTTTGSTWTERFFNWPSLLLRDPLAVLIEKEIRSLARSPRFRLVFFMGFSFGLLIWLPMIGRNPRAAADGGFGTDNFLTLVTAYALLLLGEVCFLNAFGFDRSAAQAYWVMPGTIRQVIISKNIAAMFYIVLEVAAITVVCMLVGMPVTGAKIGKALAVCLSMSLLLMSIGNLTSVTNPRPVNPNRQMRSTPAGKTQALLLLLYPMSAGPVALAYLAEYGFETPLAFFAVMGFNILIGAVIYGVALDSAIDKAVSQRERIVTALSQGEGPVAA